MARHLNPDLPAYAKNISKFRRCAGLTQKELAERTLISEFTIRKWENGQRLPEFKPLFMLCKELNAHIYNDILRKDIILEQKIYERFIEKPFRHYTKMIGDECIHTEENTTAKEKADFVLLMAEIEYPLEKNIKQLLISQYNEIYKKRNITKEKELSK